MMAAPPANPSNLDAIAASAAGASTVAGLRVVVESMLGVLRLHEEAGAAGRADAAALRTLID